MRPGAGPSCDHGHNGDRGERVARTWARGEPSCPWGGRKPKELCAHPQDAICKSGSVQGCMWPWPLPRLHPTQAPALLPAPSPSGCRCKSHILCAAFSTVRSLRIGLELLILIETRAQAEIYRHLSSYIQRERRKLRWQKENFDKLYFSKARAELTPPKGAGRGAGAAGTPPPAPRFRVSGQREPLAHECIFVRSVLVLPRPLLEVSRSPGAPVPAAGTIPTSRSLVRGGRGAAYLCPNKSSGQPGY